MKNDDPWAKIEAPAASNQISAFRIPGGGSAEWGLYWGIDAGRHCLLILQLSSRESRSHRLPKLRGLSVEALTTEGGLERIVIRLTDGEQRDLFHRFCVDIVDATCAARTAKEAVERFLSRTWRWYRLLRSGQSGRLSDEEQKGLIGELRVIEHYLLQMIEAREAVEGWAGPLGAPKDFQFGLVGIEAKARSPQRPEVRISSIHQLDLGNTARLFLSVTEVAAALEDESAAVTITDMATRVRNAIVAMDTHATIAFEERLSAAGFDWQHDYADKRWIIGDEALYEVNDAFPRITPSMVSPAVGDIRYSINLAACESFRIPATTMGETISGVRDGT